MTEPILGMPCKQRMGGIFPFDYDDEIVELMDNGKQNKSVWLFVVAFNCIYSVWDAGGVSSTTPQTMQ